jgi:CBS domain-containing protein
VRLGELCTRRVVIARRGDTVRTAAARMREEHVGDLVVIDRERRPVGIVTDRDLVLKVMADGRAPESVLVADVMSRDPVTIDGEADVSRGLAMLREHGVRRLPVVGSDGALIGILTYDDLVEWIAEELDDLVAMFGHGERREREGAPP